MIHQFPGLEVVRTSLAVLFIGVLLIACFLVLQPFLPALVWAAMIVIATWPLLLGLQARLWGRRSLAMLVLIAALLLVFVIPLSIAIGTVVANTALISSGVESLSTVRNPAPPDWLADVPLFGEKLVAKWREVAATERSDLAARVAPYLAKLLGWFASQVGNAGLLLVHFLLTVLLAAILFMKGEGAARGIRLFFGRVAGKHGESSVLLAAQAIRAVAVGIVVTSLLQSLVAGLGLLVAGIPHALLLTAAIFLLGVVQIGAGPVMLGTVIWLFWSGSTGWGIGLAVWSIVVLGMDNIIRPLFIKKGANLPLLLIFAGVIGGLIAFGIVGLFIGPVVLAITYTLVNAWIDEHTAAGVA